uniref:TYR_PHOSPHATASE_2 domain-containing protein n=1 Tax=Parastrongyloides trichosuri TaxID=131310 RepID=A0A0N4ZZ70_PARTI
MSSNDSANKNVIIPDPYQFIKFKKKGSITYSDFSTILILGIVFGSLLLILPSCALSIFIIHKYKEIKIRRQKNVYLNIETFFETYKDADFDDYVKYMLEKEYVPEKLTKETFIQTSIAGEVIVQGDSHLFDDTLVSIESIKNLGFCAHYINSEYDGKKYILCDGPTKDSMHNFWKMIYYQNISTIIINIFEEERGSENYEPYWLEKEFKFDSFNVSRISGNTPSIKYINTFIFSIKQSEEETRYVTIFLINKWADNTLPKSFNFLISLYENIEKESDNSPILIHGSDEPSSKVFIILYFICIVNSFTINKNVSEPLDIMAMIRKQKYGGLLSAGEYLFLCGGVINYFIKKKMIQEDKSTEEFMKKINEYIYGANIKEILMDRESKSFLKFITNMSSTKLVGYVEAFVRLNRKVEDDEIKKKCSLWYSVQREEIKDKSKRRLRYKDSPCWDEFNILNNSKEGSKKDRFIHANEFKYKTKNNTSRTLILSEAPIPSIFHDFYELIYTKNVYIIIMLVDKHEETKNWDKYYPGQKNEINEGKYRIEEIRGWRDKLKNISTAKFELYNKFDKITIEFKIIHLKKWELNNELPSDIMDICNLYKVIEFIDEDKSILIHCSNGFGRTGMIAYIIHMIDNAKLPIPFDPIRDFREVRRHRFGAVISVNQFIYSLMIVCHYFKKQIDRLGQDYYFKWISALDNLYKITYLMHQNLDTLININKKVETKPNEAEKNEDKSRDD